MEVQRGAELGGERSRAGVATAASVRKVRAQARHNTEVGPGGGATGGPAGESGARPRAYRTQHEDFTRVWREAPRRRRDNGREPKKACESTRGQDGVT